MINEISSQLIKDKLDAYLNTSVTYPEYIKSLSELQNITSIQCDFTKKIRDLENVMTLKFNKLTGREIVTLLNLPTSGDKHLLQSLASLKKAIGSYTNKLALAIIIDGPEAKRKVDFEKMHNILEDFECDIYVFENSVNLGYSESILKVIKILEKLHPKYIGFIDDDANILNSEHYIILQNKLDNSKYLAASGLAVDDDNGEALHDLFNIPSCKQAHEFARKAGIDTSKPHIHGGGGACLVEADHFVESLRISSERKLLIGPTISSLAHNKGSQVISTQDSFVLHETKSSLFDWLSMVLKYYSTWNYLTPKDKYNQTQYVRKFLPAYLESLKLFSVDKFNKCQILMEFRKSFKDLVIISN